MRRPIRILCSWSLLALATAACGAARTPAARTTADETPPGVQQLLPRGRIPAVFEPEFVPASRAEIPDDAWVLGVVVEDQAKAYSLNLLSRHEVVNDRSGETAYAAVW